MERADDKSWYDHEYRCNRCGNRISRDEWLDPSKHSCNRDHGGNSNEVMPRSSSTPVQEAIERVRMMVSERHNNPDIRKRLLKVAGIDEEDRGKSKETQKQAAKLDLAAGAYDNSAAGDEAKRHGPAAKNEPDKIVPGKIERKEEKEGYTGSPAANKAETAKPKPYDSAINDPVQQIHFRPEQRKQARPAENKRKEARIRRPAAIPRFSRLMHDGRGRRADFRGIYRMRRSAAQMPVAGKKTLGKGEAGHAGAGENNGKAKKNKRKKNQSGILYIILALLLIAAIGGFLMMQENGKPDLPNATKIPEEEEEEEDTTDPDEGDWQDEKEMMARIETEEIEASIFSEISTILGKSFIKNEAISRIARDHSRQMANTGDFSLGLPYVRREHAIVSLCAVEKIYKAEGVSPNNAESLPKLAAASWFNESKPESIYDNEDVEVGIGLTCDDGTCYITLDMFCLERSDSLEIEKDKDEYVSLYPAGSGTDHGGIIKIDVRANREIDIAVVDSVEGFEYFSRELSAGHIETSYGSKTLTYEGPVHPGWGLAFRNTDHDKVLVSIDREYIVVYDED